MVHKYFKTSFRHLWQNKVYTVINVSGLAIALTCVLLAVLFIKDEQSFDRFHEKKERLFRVVTNVTDGKGERKTVGGTGQPQGPIFKMAVSEIESYSRLMGGDIRGDVFANDKTLNLQLLFTDDNFFSVFSFPMLKGNPRTALSDISSVVITETVARRYFNSIDIVGKTMNMEGDPSAQKLGKPMLITGVVKDPPANSSIRFDVLLPLRFMQLSFTDDNWLNQYLGTFLLIKPGANVGNVARKFDEVFSVHAKDQVARNKQAYKYDPKISFGLQPITDIHLHPMPTGTGMREGGIVNESSPTFSYMFISIALFILVMAAINFINISIAGSLKRAKEVGVKKIIGASRKQVVVQFLGESILICVVAFALATLLSGIVLPLFNELAGKQLKLENSFDLELVGSLTLMLVLVILLTGFYPAYILSGFQPREVLYNRQKLSGRNIFGRSLVVLQFSLAVFFIITTLVYYRQMNFMRTIDLGYNPYQVIRTNINGSRDIQPVKEVLKYELGKLPYIQYLSFGGEGSVMEVKVKNKTVEAEHQVIDEYRIPAMQIKLKAGRNISPDFPSDKGHAALVNEAFVKAAGLTNPLGTVIRTNDYFDTVPRTIIGVIEDYHSGSLHRSIPPMVMLSTDWFSNGIWIKIDKKKQAQAIRAVEAAYKKAMPSANFHYDFLEDMNAKNYIQEQRWQKIIAVATAISIFVCCIGLFALARLAAGQRVKEIGIRKVLGASVLNIVTLLSKDFFVLVFIALLVASPVAWFIMRSWLQDFAYRVDIGWWVFGVAAFLALMIAMLTVCLQAVKVANANPVNSLRTE